VFSFWFIFYPAAFLGGILYIILRVLGFLTSGFLKVKGFKDFPKNKKSIVVIANHGGLWAPLVLIMIFWPRLLFHPIKYFPWHTPDKGNYDKWWWALFNSRFVLVPRGKYRSERDEAIKKIITLIKNGHNVIIFPEGGRTSKGTSFIYSSRLGKRMRHFKSGIGQILSEISCYIVPVWVDGEEQVLPIGKVFPRLHRRMTITGGTPFFHKQSPDGSKETIQKICKNLEQVVLEVADQGE